MAQSVDPADGWRNPAAHKEHTLALPPEYWPAPQVVGPALALAGQKLPAGHWAQLIAEAPEY